MTLHIPVFDDLPDVDRNRIQSYAQSFDVSGDIDHTEYKGQPLALIGRRTSEMIGIELYYLIAQVLRDPGRPHQQGKLDVLAR